MSDLQGIADRVEIEALPGEYTDAAMTRDYDRFTSLFTPAAVLRIPETGIELAGREEIRAGIEQMQAKWEFFVQTTHPERSRSTAAPRPALPTSASSGACATASGCSTAPPTTTATNAPQTAGSSPSAPTKSGTSTPPRWRARRTLAEGSRKIVRITTRTGEPSMIRIGIILGSTRPNRNGEQVATWVYDMATRRSDAEFELIDLRDAPLRAASRAAA
jgi:hypothetical protein